ncbi:MAG: hypothetical protein RL748_3507 [Pseudomonadota bacterium]|jgi:hypothetical protein
MKKIQVERIHQSQGRTKATMSKPEFMLFAERVEEIFQQQIEKRASTKNGNADEFEVITEWL